MSPDPGIPIRPLEALPRTTASPDVAAAAALRIGRPVAWWGMLMVIAGEGTLFLALLATYAYLRFGTTAWPPDGIHPPAVTAPVILTAVLLVTSLPAQLASRAARRGRLATARWALVAALLVQAGYLAYQARDYLHQLDRLPVGTDAYTSIYYVLLGADHAHVAVGILLELWLLAKLLRGLTTYRANAALAIAWYWHFVNVATILVTATLLSARA